MEKYSSVGNYSVAMDVEKSASISDGKGGNCCLCCGMADAFALCLDAAKNNFKFEGQRGA